MTPSSQTTGGRAAYQGNHHRSPTALVAGPTFEGRAGVSEFLRAHQPSKQSARVFVVVFRPSPLCLLPFHGVEKTMERGEACAGKVSIRSVN